FPDGIEESQLVVCVDGSPEEGERRLCRAVLEHPRIGQVRRTGRRGTDGPILRVVVVLIGVPWGLPLAVHTARDRGTSRVPVPTTEVETFRRIERGENARTGPDHLNGHSPCR